MNFDLAMNIIQASDSPAPPRRSVKDAERSGSVTLVKHKEAKPKQRDFEVTVAADGKFTLRRQASRKP